jgi:predicted membrane protein
MVLIFFGWMIMGGGTDGRLNWVVMGGHERKGAPWELKTGSYFVLMGGVELDLREAIIPEGETTLDFTIIMGGVEIRLPEELEVECEGTAILGGLEFLGQSAGGLYGGRVFKQSADNDNKKVKITCRVLMGGVTVK